MTRSPWWELGRRLLMAAAVLTATVALVWFDRDGYVDNSDPTGTVDLADLVSAHDAVEFEQARNATGHRGPEPAFGSGAPMPPGA